jgi:hypothetical protein
MLPKFKTLITVFLISAFLLPTDGCDFNETVVKTVAILKYCAEVYTSLETEQAVANAVKEWYDGKVPVISKIQEGVYLLCWAVDCNKPKEHFGVEQWNTGYSEDSWKFGKRYKIDPNDVQTEVVSAPNLGERQDATLGRVLDVTNPSGLSLRVSNLQVAVSTTHIPLDQLAYYDPEVSSLPWEQVISTPTDFSPGETKTFDVRDGSMVGLWCYVRVLFGPTSGVGLSGEAVYSFLNPNVIPTLSEWGLIIMAGLLLTAGAIVIRRRFKAVPV